VILFPYIIIIRILLLHFRILVKEKGILAKTQKSNLNFQLNASLLEIRAIFQFKP